MPKYNKTFFLMNVKYDLVFGFLDTPKSFYLIDTISMPVLSNSISGACGETRCRFVITLQTLDRLKISTVDIKSSFMQC